MYICLKLILWFMLMYGNEVKLVIKGRPVRHSRTRFQCKNVVGFRLTCGSAFTSRSYGCLITFTRLCWAWPRRILIVMGTGIHWRTTMMRTILWCHPLLTSPLTTHSDIRDREGLESQLIRVCWFLDCLIKLLRSLTRTIFPLFAASLCVEVSNYTTKGRVCKAHMVFMFYLWVLPL